MPLTINKWLAE